MSVVSDGEKLLTFLNIPTLIKESQTSECRCSAVFWRAKNKCSWISA